MPRGGGIPDGHYVYAFEVRSDGVCDAQLRACDDGHLRGSYRLDVCPSSSDKNVSYRDDYVYENVPEPIGQPKNSNYIQLLPGVDGSHWYDLDGKRINPNQPAPEVKGIIVKDPEPLWDVTVQPVYDCKAPWGEVVPNGQFVKAYRYRE